MAWTNAQKKMMAMRCTARRINDETRRFILLQIDNAQFDRTGRPTPGKASATSKKLTDADFDRFLQLIGDVVDPLQREKHKARQLLERTEPRMDRAAWEKWCKRQIGRVAVIDEMTGHELFKIIEGLKAITGNRPKRRKASSHQATKPRMTNNQQPATNNPSLQLVGTDDECIAGRIGPPELKPVV